MDRCYFAKTFLLTVVTLTAIMTASSSSSINATKLFSPSLRMTEGQSDGLANELKFFDSILNNSATQMTNQLNDPSNSQANNCPTSTFSLVCPPSTQVPIINFSNGIPSDLAYVQIRPYDQSQTIATKQTQMCQIANMKSTWIANFNKSDNRLMYQYFSFKDELVGFFPAAPQNCSKRYTPTHRPYYQSAATGQKDLVILIDVSTKDTDFAWRIAEAKQMTISLLKTLSFRDFVAVIPYNTGTLSCCNNSLLQQATTDNIKNLINSVQNDIAVPPVPSTVNDAVGTNLGDAMDVAAKLIQKSVLLGATSKCTQALVLLSGGSNDGQVPPASVVLDENPNLIAFSFLIKQLNATNSGASNTVTVIRDRRIRLATLACMSRGVYRGIFTDADASAQWSVVNDYFAQLQVQVGTRFSQVYVDALTGADVLSASAPVYTTDEESGLSYLAGVITLDAPASSLNASAGNNLTIEEINGILLANQTCTPLDQTSSTKDAVVKDIQNGTCDGIEPAAEAELAMDKAKTAIVICSVLFACIGGFIPFYYWVKRDWGNSCTPVGVVFMLISYIVAASVCFTLVFPDLVRKFNYIPEDFYVKKVQANPYPCCELIDCRCENYYGDSCSAKLAELQPGPCQNGYYCCQQESYSCNCHSTSYSCGSSTRHRTCWRTTCSTCYRCVESVSQRYCVSVCGTCYKPLATVSYDYRGRDETSYFNTQCGLNDTTCLNNFMKEYAVGNVIPGFVDPSNPQHIVRSVAVRTAPFVAFVCFAVFMGVFFICVYCMMIKGWKDEQQKDNTATLNNNNRGGTSSSDWISIKNPKNSVNGDRNYSPTNNNSSVNNNNNNIATAGYVNDANFVNPNDYTAPPPQNYNNNNQTGFAGYPGFENNNNNNNNATAVTGGYPYYPAPQQTTNYNNYPTA